jgi:hypothetical protein
MILCLGQHSIRATGRVKHFADNPRFRQDIVVGVKQNFYHQTDDFARGKVIARGLISGFVKTADVLFKRDDDFALDPAFAQIAEGGRNLT